MSIKTQGGKVMRINKSILLIMVWIITVLILHGCSYHERKNERMSSEKFIAMDTVFSIQLPENFSYLNETVVKMVEHYNNLWDKHHPSSQIYAINHRDDSQVHISQETFQLVTKAWQLAELTDGYFDPTVGVLVDIWDWNTAKVPDEKTVLEKIQHVGYGQIAIDKGDYSMTFANEHTQIDLGGIAKGYTTKKIKELLEDNGVESALIAAGGNQYALGKKNDGNQWTVGIRHPRNPEKILGSLAIENMAIDTSGDYERFFMLPRDGTDHSKRYHHVLNPKNGYPGEGIASVTIVTPCSIEADALSTAIMAGGLELAFDLYQQLDNFDFIIVDQQLKVYISENIQQTFIPMDQLEVMVFSAGVMHKII